MKTRKSTFALAVVVLVIGLLGGYALGLQGQSTVYAEYDCDPVSPEAQVVPFARHHVDTPIVTVDYDPVGEKVGVPITENTGTTTIELVPTVEPTPEPTVEPEPTVDVPPYGHTHRVRTNNGHGNNVDGVDMSNPGKSKRHADDTDPTVDDEKKPKKVK